MKKQILLTLTTLFLFILYLPYVTVAMPQFHSTQISDIEDSTSGSVLPFSYVEVPVRVPRAAMVDHHLVTHQIYAIQEALESGLPLRSRSGLPGKVFYSPSRNNRISIFFVNRQTDQMWRFIFSEDGHFITRYYTRRPHIWEYFLSRIRKEGLRYLPPPYIVP